MKPSRRDRVSAAGSRRRRSWLPPGALAESDPAHGSRRDPAGKYGFPRRLAPMRLRRDASCDIRPARSPLTRSQMLTPCRSPEGCHEPSLHSRCLWANDRSNIKASTGRALPALSTVPAIRRRSRTAGRLPGIHSLEKPSQDLVLFCRVAVGTRPFDERAARGAHDMVCIDKCSD
jgi:hypothetical protein